jgi:hypothetical protein
MVRQPRPPEVDARAIRACFHGLVAKMPGQDPQGEFRAPGALEAQQIGDADWNNARVPAATRRALQAIERLRVFF